MRSDEDSLRSLRGPGEARKWSPVEIRLSNLTPSSTAYKWSADSTSARLIAALNGLKMMDTEGKLSELMDFIRAERARLELSEAGRSRRVRP